VNNLTLQAIKYYNFAENKYHNFEHALGVYETVKVWGCDTAMQLAAIWHDAVYIPGARDGLNEDMSAQALTHAWIRSDCKGDIPTLHKACRLICETKVSNHLLRRNIGEGADGIGYLLDADLASLAGTYEQFTQNQINIQIENNLNPNTKGSRSRTGNFLSTFLTCRPSIYRKGT
jgi:predicted metal-dependent HD superfamily phosphohydrolase